MKHYRFFSGRLALGIVKFILLTTGVVTCLAGELAWAQLRGYSADFTNPAVLIDIDHQSGAVSAPTEYAACNTSQPNTLFSVNFTSGLAYMNDVLYGLEWDQGSGPDIYLYTVSSSDCAIGTRIGSQPVGFQNLESLVYVPGDGLFYSVDFDFSTHTGRLIKIDPATGVGTLVGGSMSVDVKVGGLAYDPQADILFAVTLANGSRGTELLTIDRTTGQETLIGATGTAGNSLQSLGIVTGSTPAKLFAAGTQLYELNRSTGEAVLVGGNFSGTVWGMASAPSSAPVAVPPVPGITANGSGGTVSINAGDALSIEVSLSTGSHSGADADWWVAVYGPDGWHYFSLTTALTFAGTSHTDLITTYQGALFDLNTIGLFNPSGLPKGTHTFFFAVDTLMNGSLDFDQIYFDSVTVNIN